jgi:hypothetical protein
VVHLKKCNFVRKIEAELPDVLKTFYYATFKKKTI